MVLTALISLLLFPGIIFHEFSHWIACEAMGVKVRKVKLFGLREAFVKHERPNAVKLTVIETAPFILGNVFGWLLLGHAHKLLFEADFLAFLFYWLALSMMFYSFPSRQDTGNVLKAITDYFFRHIFRKRNLGLRLTYLILFPFIFIPVALMLSIMLLFNYFTALRLLWLVILFSFSLVA